MYGNLKNPKTWNSRGNRSGVWEGDGKVLHPKVWEDITKKTL